MNKIKILKTLLLASLCIVCFYKIHSMDFSKEIILAQGNTKDGKLDEEFLKKIQKAYSKLKESYSGDNRREFENIEITFEHKINQLSLELSDNFNIQEELQQLNGKYGATLNDNILEFKKPIDIITLRKIYLEKLSGKIKAVNLIPNKTYNKNCPNIQLFVEDKTKWIFLITFGGSNDLGIFKYYNPKEDTLF